MFVRATKRQQIYLNPSEYKNASEEKWKENFSNPKRSGRVPGEALDFFIICPLAEKAEEGDRIYLALNFNQGIANPLQKSDSRYGLYWYNWNFASIDGVVFQTYVLSSTSEAPGRRRSRCGKQWLAADSQ